MAVLLLTTYELLGLTINATKRAIECVALAMAFVTVLGPTLFLCVMRLPVMSAIYLVLIIVFCFLYVSQVYPTTTRALGLGSCSGMARVGAIVTPFIAQVRKLDQNHF